MVDAVFYHKGIQQAYLFGGCRYARIEFVPQDEGYYFFGARFARIKLKLTNLGQAGFDTIDAALPVPGDSGEAYIFRGVNYVRINVCQNRIVYGPAKLTVEWPGLTKAGFDSFDAACPEPGSTNGMAYFLKGDQYVKIRVDHWKTLDWI
ncbi:hypothetical protein BDV10DRAFT_194536 [Aspergillus recurvatus]